MTAPARNAYDVIVIGYGYAGAVAALAAADAGARVLLMEKASLPGGISICSAGGLRIADDAERAFAYLRRTCGGKTPDDVLDVLARGMTGLADRLEGLASICGAKVIRRASPGNYPLDGHETFGFANIEDIPGFDPASAYPHVRGARAGALLFRVLQANIEANRERIDIALECPAIRLSYADGRVAGVHLDNGSTITARRGVVLACGGFEADQEMQAQFWNGGPALNAAYRHNTGDGIRMAQSLGADLWHMWHYHGSYGFRVPDVTYPYGVRVKRLPDWQPGREGTCATPTPPMAWILVDQDGNRFMNEYEPYLQDTGARPLAHFDPARQAMPRVPAYLIVDRAGLALYPLGKPTRNDPDACYEWSADNSAEIASGLFHASNGVGELAEALDIPPAALERTISRWNELCTSGNDADFGRPPTSMQALTAPPFFGAPVHPIVSNTQGGPRHDADQRIVDVFGKPIPGLYAAGECGSAFGHLYMSGGNLAECFVGGEIAGRNAAQTAVAEKRTTA